MAGLAALALLTFTPGVLQFTNKLPGLTFVANNLGLQSNPCPGFAFAEEVPRPVGFVDDFAGVIPEETKARMEAISCELEEKTGAELVVVTVKTTGGIEIHDYSVDLFMKWGIGKKGKDNGLLLVAAIEDKKLWIKTGYGLEDVIPDAIASQIYRNILRPSFREGDYGGGLLSAVNVIAARIAKQEGVTLASVDRLAALPRDISARKNVRSVMTIIFVIIFVILMIVSSGGRRPGSRRSTGFPFWMIGGFGGGLKGGGFGGGFGGFGGGSCGGGGAGGGW
ncbi:MAG: TPM domain-containing protein [Candidatus Eisenbacteria bacterium]|nr:TPM domain-containing protein [Candidatus Eisenbacteria bacterium]